MSDGPIRPSDITCELVEKLLAVRETNDWKEQIADDLNAAVELGVVSPPCHYIQHEDGWSPRVNGKLRIWPGKPEPGFAQYRHWKGEE